MKYLTPKVRRRIYETSIGAIGVAVVYGLVNGDEASAWLALIGAVLGVARANVQD